MSKDDLTLERALDLMKEAEWKVFEKLIKINTIKNTIHIVSADFKKEFEENKLNCKVIFEINQELFNLDFDTDLSLTANEIFAIFSEKASEVIAKKLIVAYAEACGENLYAFNFET